ncbi:Hemin transport protein, partial [Stenotrophomonas sp. HMWF023]
MSRALSARRLPSSLSRSSLRAWPAPEQLAALGTVLCLYHADGNELGGWRQAVSVHACQGVDSEGLRESLCFLDARGRCVWRLYLLPDSDFLAWDRLVATLPPGPSHDADGSVGERLWRRLAGHLGGQRWRLCTLRLHAADEGRTLA